MGLTKKIALLLCHTIRVCGGFLAGFGAAIFFCPVRGMAQYGRLDLYRIPGSMAACRLASIIFRHGRFATPSRLSDEICDDVPTPVGIYANWKYCLPLGGFWFATRQKFAP
jgi:hypothetical protein